VRICASGTPPSRATFAVLSVPMTVAPVRRAMHGTSMQWLK
jgi:hypothetical protein